MWIQNRQNTDFLILYALTMIIIARRFTVKPLIRLYKNLSSEAVR